MCRRGLSIIIILIILLSVSGCGLKEEGKVTNKLKVFLAEYCTFAEMAVNDFANVNTNLDVKIETHTASSEAEMEQYRQYLKEALLSDDGADVVIFRSQDISEMYKFILEGVFADINPLIKEDKDFSLMDYHNNILDGGVFDEKRYLIPLNFIVPVLQTTKGILEENNIGNIDEKPDICHFAGLAEEFDGANKPYFLDKLDIIDLFYASGTYPVNLHGSEEVIDTEGLQEMLKQYKSVYDSVMPSEIYQSYYQNDKNNISSNLLKNKNVIFTPNGIYSFRSLWQSYGTFEDEVEPVIYAKPGQYTYAYPDVIVGIRSGSSNKKAAYELVKMLLDEKYQGQDMIVGFPVNKKAYRAYMNEALNNPVSQGNEWRKNRGGGCKEDATIEKMADRVNGIIEGMDSCIIRDEYIEKSLLAQTNEFIYGKINIDEAAGAIQKDAVDYLQSDLVEAAKETVNMQAVENVNGSEEKKKLKMFNIYYSRMFADAITTFNLDSDNVEIESQVFNSYEEYLQRFTASVLAGEGPDIIWDYGSNFMSIHKAMDSGIFMDLNELIESDDSFNQEDYSSIPYNSGVYRGKRYFIPLAYNISSLSTTKELMDSNGIRFEDIQWNWSGLGDVVSDYKSGTPGNADYFFAWNFDFSNVFANCGIKLVDYENKQSFFNNSDFIELLKIYKKIEDKVLQPQDYSKYGNCFDLLKNNNALMVNIVELLSPGHLQHDIQELGEGLVIYPFPMAKGEQEITVSPEYMMSINSKCAYKEEAFEFLKYLLSTEIQMHDQLSNGSIPINKEAYRKLKEQYYTKGMEAQTQMVEDIVSRIGSCDIQDAQINDIVYQEASEFFKGKQTAEEAARQIDEMVELFLNE